MLMVLLVLVVGATAPSTAPAPDSLALQSPPPALQNGSAGLRVAKQLGGGIPIEAVSLLVSMGLAYTLTGRDHELETYAVEGLLLSSIPTSLAVYGIGSRSHAGEGAISTTLFGGIAGAAICSVPYFAMDSRDRPDALAGGWVAALVIVPLGALLGYHNSIEGPGVADVQGINGAHELRLRVAGVKF